MNRMQKGVSMTIHYRHSFLEQSYLISEKIAFMISFTHSTNTSSGNEGVGGFDVCMTLRIKHGKDSQPYFRG